jgi:hypothetical protein
MIDQGFILSLFSEATRRKDFQHKWMSSDTCVALINTYYVFDNALAFNGKDLLASINSKKQRNLQAQKMGMSVATNPKTIEKWYRNL